MAALEAVPAAQIWQADTSVAASITPVWPSGQSSHVAAVAAPATPECLPIGQAVQLGEFATAAYRPAPQVWAPDAGWCEHAAHCGGCPPETDLAVVRDADKLGRTAGRTVVSGWGPPHHGRRPQPAE